MVFYLDHITAWNKYTDDKNVMFATYEELKENPTLGLKKIAEFFEFSVTEQDIENAVEKTSFKAMKEKGSEINRVAAKSLFRKEEEPCWIRPRAHLVQLPVSQRPHQMTRGAHKTRCQSPDTSLLHLAFEESVQFPFESIYARCHDHILWQGVPQTCWKQNLKFHISEIPHLVCLSGEPKMDEIKKHSVEFYEKMLLDGSKLASEEKLFSYKGVLYPAAICNQETLRILDTFEARRDDVILAGYPKTGTHWLHEILNNVVETGAKYTEVEKKNRMDIEAELAMPPRLEFVHPDTLKRMGKLPSRRIIVTHLYPNVLPKSIFKNKAKVLVLIRNPKDTLASYFHFNNKMSVFSDITWDSYFTDFMNGKVAWGSYFDYFKEWDKYIDDENVTALTYEELKENPNLGVKKIAAFLGFSLNEEEIHGVIEKISFKVMREKAPNTLGSFRDILFRKGSVGDWRSLLSDAQNQEMDRKFEESLAGTKLGAKIKYEVYCKI